MPLDPSISLQAKTPDGMTSLRDILGAASSYQGYQNAQLANQQGQVDLQTKARVNAEAQAIANSKSQWTNPDGSINMQAASQVIPQVAPTTGAQALQNLAAADQMHTQATVAKQNMDSGMRGILGSTYAAMARIGITTPDKVAPALDTLASQYPDSPELQQYVQAAKFGLSKYPAGADLTQQLGTTAQSLLGPAEQQSTFGGRVTPMNVGGSTINAQQGPVGANGMPSPITAGPPIANNTMPPGTTDVVGKDNAGNQVVHHYSPTGQYLGMTPMPGGSGTYTPQTPAPGETPETMAALQQYRQTVNHAATQVPQVEDTSKQIIAAAKELQVSGEFGKNFANISSLLNYKAGSDSATKLQSLGHYTAMQTAQLAAQMGLDGSLGALGKAADIAGNNTFTPDAIISITNTNRALNAGIGLYNQGMEGAIQKSGGNPAVIRQFQTAWSRYFDVNSVRLLMAMNSGDTGAFNQVVKGLGGRDSLQYRTLVRNMTVLNGLTAGDIPAGAPPVRVPGVQ